MVLGVVVVSTLVACGDDGGSDDESSATALVDRLSGNVPYLAAVDLAEVREQVDADADAELELNENLFEDEDLGRYFALAAVGLPYITYASEIPVAAAIDPGLVQEAASMGAGTDLEHGAIVLRTEQSVDDITEVLEGEGYEPDGDYVRITFDYDDPEDAVRTPLDHLRGDLLPESLYEC